MTATARYDRALGVGDWFRSSLSASTDTTVLPYNICDSLGCSVVYYPPDHTASGHAILSRNYDFTTGTWAELLRIDPEPGARATTEDPYVMEVYPDTGYASLYLCAYELLGGCLDGINEKALIFARRITLL